MRRLFVVGSLIALVLAACTTASPPVPSPAPSPSPAQPATGAASTPGGPSWDQVVAAAKQEGQVVVWGQGVAGAEAAFSADFEKQYPDVHVDYEAGTSPQQVTQIIAARQAGQNNVDLFIHGPSDVLGSLIPAGAVDPVQPYLVGPDDTDPTVWLGGHLSFSDDTGMYALLFSGGVVPPFAYNPTLVSSSEITSLRDLLDLRWKGKIAMLDPRISGSGQNTAAFWYQTPSLGQDFMQQLFSQQDVVLTRDQQQLTDFVAHGEYPIALSPSTSTAINMQGKGASIELESADGVQEHSYLSAGFGGVAVLSRAPHPNATRVYLNWLLSREGQADAIATTAFPSRRLDVPTTDLPAVTVPNPAVQHLDSSSESFVHVQSDVVLPLLNSLIPG